MKAGELWNEADIQQEKGWVEGGRKEMCGSVQPVSSVIDQLTVPRELSGLVSTVWLWFVGEKPMAFS